MLPLFFIGTLGFCFCLIITALKPDRSVEQVHLRLASIRRMHQAASQQADPALEHSRDDWRTQCERQLLATGVGRRLADLLLQSRSHRTVPAFLAISAMAGMITGVTAGFACGSGSAGTLGAFAGA